MHLARRCLAHGKRTGKPCQSPAMPNGRCRLHGDKSPRPPKGNRNAWKHGGRSAEAIELRRAVNLLARLARRAA
ncbi:MAG: HGGxSTG domain-containing protein [Xanthobacteraceae bacterium]